jgi:type I restriction enzyme S subunit
MSEDVYRVADLEERGWLRVEDGNHGEYRPRPDEFGRGEVRFVRAQDMHDGRVDFDGTERIGADARARIRKGIGAPGDVLFSHKGTVGKVALTPADSPPFVCSPQTTFWRTLDETHIDRIYLYGFLRSPEFTEQWEARKDETDMAAYVSLTAQRELVIRLPPIEEQRAIGALLRPLDDKIELNRRMSRALEELSSALFKSWFVDFDPVQAKRDGRSAVGVPAGALPFFSAHFDESEFGPIPRGWKVGTVGDLIELQRGFDLPSSNRRPGPYPVVAASGVHGFHDTCQVQGPGVTTGRSGVIGEVFFVYEDFWPLNTSLWVKGYAGSSRYHAYFLLKDLDLIALNAGSAVPTLNRNHVHALPAVVPERSVVTAFDEVVPPLFQRKRLCMRESVGLARLRDALLPALLSGDIHVKQAEEAVAGVA